MIKQHGVECPNCHDQIYSNHRHDMVTCTRGATYIDGGFDYLRSGYNPDYGPGIPIQRTLDVVPHRSFRSEQRKRK